MSLLQYLRTRPINHEHCSRLSRVRLTVSSRVMSVSCPPLRRYDRATSRHQLPLYRYNFYTFLREIQDSFLACIRWIEYPNVRRLITWRNTQRRACRQLFHRAPRSATRLLLQYASRQRNTEPYNQKYFRQSFDTYEVYRFDVCMHSVKGSVSSLCALNGKAKR